MTEKIHIYKMHYLSFKKKKSSDFYYFNTLCTAPIILTFFTQFYMKCVITVYLMKIEKKVSNLGLGVLQIILKETGSIV